MRSDFPNVCQPRSRSHRLKYGWINSSWHDGRKLGSILKQRPNKSCPNFLSMFSGNSSAGNSHSSPFREPIKYIAEVASSKRENGGDPEISSTIVAAKLHTSARRQPCCIFLWSTLLRR